MKRNFSLKKFIVSFILILVMIIGSMPAFAINRSSTLANKGDTYIVNCSGLNVRTGAGMKYSIRTVAKRGTLMSFNYMQNGWWNITLPDGSTGFVDKQYLAPTTKETTGYYAVTSTALNVRVAPRDTTKKVTTLKSGVTVRVVKLNGDWGYITYGNTAGWVALKYLGQAGSGTSVSCNKLNVRSKPSRSGKILDVITRGTNVTVIATKSGWAHISYTRGGKTKDGYVSANYLR